MHRPAACLLVLGLAACQQVAPPPPAAPAQQGQASYYGPEFTGRRTASGERFDPNSNMAAHRTLPLGTVAQVTNLQTGQSETVRIADRGPYVRGRIVDVSPGTARRLGMRRQGVAPVAVTPISVPGQSGGSGAEAPAAQDAGATR